MVQAASPAPPRATSTRSKSRSRSASSVGSSRARSRSRERTSRRSSHRSKGRSRSTSRARHGSSRHSHRSRSRERGGRRGRDRNGHHSSRHRDRSRSRSRERGRHRRHSGSSRKSSRRERSRSTEGGRRRRDSSPRDDDNGHGRRQRRRLGSDAQATDSKKGDIVQTTSSDVPSHPDVSKQAGSSNGTSEVAKHEVAGKEETPTSQDSVATSTATATASSQSDAEITSKPLQAKDGNAPREQKDPTVGTTQVVKQSPPTAVKVDVKSIKMDILKALADARSTIAGIKGAVPTASTAPTTVLNPTPETIVAVAPQTTADITDPPASESTHDAQPLPVVVVNLPPQQQDSTADADEFDMFSAAELHGAGLPLSPAAAPAMLVVGTAVQSNFDDADGYYKPNIGEILNSKYRVMGTVGKGVFSTVLRCQRLASSGDDSDIVAIKLIRNNDIMREASQTEIKILTDLSQRDPRDKKHCVRLLERFEHRNHVALVFESMQMNVREAMKKFGGKGGISIQAVRIFCKHLLIALTHLEACGIVHADIKPDNVLLDEKQTMIKLCDFGSAFEAKEGKHDPTPYLVSRFYRAPEIVLGLRYDKAVDMWSVGCCLYEMFTGKVMFPGATNNEMLKLFMELKGKVPNKIIKKHRQAYIEQFQMEPHFTEENKFCSHEIDRVTGKPVLRLMDAMRTRFDLGSALLGAKSSTDDRKQVLELKDLLERMFTLDPTKRITPKEALAHPFVKTEGKQAA